jgi:hypothetical protein
MEYQAEREALLLTAVGAVFRVEIFRRHTEHVVTLDANTMQSGLPGGRRFVLWGLSLRVSGFRHE